MAGGGKTGQLPLPFVPGRSFAEADFVPGAANEEARAWLARWPGWPSGRLVLWGPEGSGKSHLAAIWQGRAKAAVTTGAALAEAEPEAALGLCTEAGAVLVEDADAAPQGRAMLHLINAASERRASLLMTARDPPGRWRASLPDLRSRLAATASVAIAAPDESLLEAVLAKHLADRGTTLRPDLLSWLVLRAPRDFSTIHALAAELDAGSLAAARAVTRPMAAEALARAMAATGHAAPEAGSDDNSMAPEHPPSRREGPLG